MAHADVRDVQFNFSRTLQVRHEQRLVGYASLILSEVTVPFEELRRGQFGFNLNISTSSQIHARQQAFTVPVSPRGPNTHIRSSAVTAVSGSARTVVRRELVLL